MNYKLNVNLSPELEQYRDKIEATIKPYIEITLQENDKLNWWQSKFGGLPYLPKDFDYPKTLDGQYLFLLAQINFAEVPQIKDFPEKGILQFYIAEESYGQNYDNPTEQTGFRILYFPGPDLNEENLITNYSFLPETYELPIYGCCSLKFTQKYAPISYEDYQVQELLGSDLYNLLWADYELEDEYTELSSSYAHKIGGYPYFVQSDPREKSDSEEPYILLLQIDTDGADNAVDAISIMWGDAGIGNFFIKQSALKNLDFSDVIYYWDCA